MQLTSQDETAEYKVAKLKAGHVSFLPFLQNSPII